jgi:hypothetical protein
MKVLAMVLLTIGALAPLVASGPDTAPDIVVHEKRVPRTRPLRRTRIA